MNAYRYFLGTLTLFLCVMGFAFLSHADDRAAALQQKMADINLLQNQLNERKSEAIEIREKLYTHLSTLKAEIETVAAKENINEFKTAQNIPRIRYNMRLIAEILSYIDQFNQKIRYFQIGQDKLEYLYQQADDDLKIINTLTNLKIEALVSQIDVIVFEYLPEAHRILITLDALNVINAETVWRKIIQD